MKKESTKFAQVTWCWEDIKSLRPRWSKEQCEEFLETNERRIADRMVEMGWEVINDLL